MVRSQIKVLQILAFLKTQKTGDTGPTFPVAAGSQFIAFTIYRSLFLYWGFIIAVARLLSSDREIFICIMSLSQMEKEKWTEAKGILVSREL